MSSRHTGGRLHPRQHAHLVLVRGGLDASAEATADKDWRAFCDRIGWRSTTPAPPDDYEDRLALRVFGAPPPAEPVGASFITATQARKRPRRRASVAFLVAAVVGVAAAALVPLLSQPAPPVSVRPEPAATQVNQLAPEPSRPEPERSESEKKESSKPAPDPIGPRPNGSRHSHVARVRGPARPGRAAGRATPPADERLAVVAQEAETQEKDAFSDVAAPAPPAAAPTLAWSAAPARVGSRAPVPVEVAAPAAFLDWSLSLGGDRWYGASLPPSSEPIDAANAGAIGVMAKVDFAKLAAF